MTCASRLGLGLVLLAMSCVACGLGFDGDGETPPPSETLFQDTDRSPAFQECHAENFRDLPYTWEPLEDGSAAEAAGHTRGYRGTLRKISVVEVTSGPPDDDGFRAVEVKTRFDPIMLLIQRDPGQLHPCELLLVVEQSIQPVARFVCEGRIVEAVAVPRVRLIRTPSPPAEASGGPDDRVRLEILGNHLRFFDRSAAVFSQEGRPALLAVGEEVRLEGDRQRLGIRPVAQDGTPESLAAIVIEDKTTTASYCAGLVNAGIIPRAETWEA